MLLIRFNVWFGPSRDWTNSGKPYVHGITEKVEAYVTRLSLADAVLHMRAYEHAFNKRYAAVNATVFTLLGVDAIDDLDEEAADLARVRLIEDMPTKAEEL